jgi:MFS family permease
MSEQSGNGTQRMGGSVYMTDTNRGYEYKLLAIFFITWGIVFMDRLAISFLAPIVTPKLNMNNADIGWVGFATSFCFAISSITFGFVSDRLGYRKRILLPFLLGTAIFSAAGVMVNSFAQLLLVRALVGFCEGPVSPIIYSMLFTVNKENFGRNCGILNSSIGTIGTTIGPVFITQIAKAYSWQMTFLLSSLPTFVMFLVVWFFVREMHVEKETVQGGEKSASFGDLFKYRNVVVCLIMCVLGLSGYWTMMLFAQVYLVNISHFNLQSSGWVTSAMGCLYIVYCILLPKLADNFGRKPVMCVGFMLSIVAPLFMYLFPGTSLSVYTYIFFFGFTAAVVPIYMTMVPMESVPITLVATGSALVQGTGDCLGAAVWPVIAGKIADAKGLPFMMLIAALLLAVTALLSLTLKETRPRKKAQADAAKYGLVSA